MYTDIRMSCYNEQECVVPPRSLKSQFTVLLKAPNRTMSIGFIYIQHFRPSYIEFVRNSSDHFGTVNVFDTYIE